MNDDHDAQINPGLLKYRMLASANEIPVVISVEILLSFRRPPPSTAQRPSGQPSEGPPRRAGGGERRRAAPAIRAPLPDKAALSMCVQQT